MMPDGVAGVGPVTAVQGFALRFPKEKVDTGIPVWHSMFRQLRAFMPIEYDPYVHTRKPLLLKVVGAALDSVILDLTLPEPLNYLKPS